MLTYAVGDVHGMLLQFRTLVFDSIPRHAAGRPWRLVFLGDLVDRGADSRTVVEDVIRLRAGQWPTVAGVSPNAPVEVVCLRGNHEDMLLAGIAAGANSQVAHWWLGHGGRQTMASYGWSPARPGAAEVGEFAVPRAHRDFFATLPRFYETDTHFFVHAGCSPDRDLDWHRIDGQAQDDVLMWIRPGFVDSTKDWGKPIVHGHTPRPQPYALPNRIGVDTGCYDTGILTAVCLDGQDHSFVQARGLRSSVWPS